MTFLVSCTWFFLVCADASGSSTYMDIPSGNGEPAHPKLDAACNSQTLSVHAERVCAEQ